MVGSTVSGEIKTTRNPGLFYLVNAGFCQLVNALKIGNEMFHNV